MVVCMVSSAFASRLVSVLGTTEAAVFFFMVCMLPFSVLASSFKVRWDGQIKECGMGGVC